MQIKMLMDVDHLSIFASRSLLLTSQSIYRCVLLHSHIRSLFEFEHSF